MLWVTADPDWQRKWATPSANGLQLGRTHEVRLGGRITVLTFLSNPGLDADGRADVRCSLSVTHPDGTPSSSQSGVPCFNTRLATGPHYVYLANLVVQFTGEPSDQVGVYRVDMVLRDAIRGIDLPLRTTYELLAPGR